MSISLSIALTLAVQTPVGPSSGISMVEAAEACRAIRGDADRLACYDRAIATLAEARARRDVVIVDREQMKRTRRGLFGFTLPSLKIFGGSDKDEEAEQVRQLESKVASAAPYGYGYLTLVLEDGSVWQTRDRVRGFDPRSGEAITIKRNAFGSYMAMTKGSPSVRVQRVK